MIKLNQVFLISIFLFLSNTICFANKLFITGYIGIKQNYITEWENETDFNYPILKPLNFNNIGLGSSYNLNLSYPSQIGIRFTYHWNQNINKDLYHFDIKTETKIYLVDLLVNFKLYKIRFLDSSLNLLGGVGFTNEDHYQGLSQYSKTDKSKPSPTFGIELKNALSLLSFMQVSMHIGYRYFETKTIIKTIPKTIELENDPNNGNNEPIRTSSQYINKLFKLDSFYLLFSISIKV